MADSTVGMLPRASQIDDDSLLLMEQQGQAMNFTGKQLKDYAKAGLEANFADDIKAANDAAYRAKEAASAVTEMTVEAHASDMPTVKKTIKNGVVNLDYGLPRGPEGKEGPEGPQGKQGPKGDTGTGLDIQGHYNTEQELREAVKSPKVGEQYSVGTDTPFNLFVFDGVILDWKDYGPIMGGGGGPLPDNVVTADGGGEMEVEGNIGEGPYKFIFTDEEEPPLTADDVKYSGGTVKDALEQLFTSVDNGKDLIASAITDMGVDTKKDATFQQMADNIREIETGGGGIDPSDATATPGDILAGKTAYTASGKVEGVIPSLQARTITPTTEAQSIAAGNYIAGTQIIRGDTNLQPSNIRKGITLFDVSGAMESTFQATLTVTVDAGAVVTATHSDKVTKVEGLSITGKVTLELPIEGQWTITAQRGVSQYNSVVINVTSSYTATLTAEVHIKYFGKITSLSASRGAMGTASIGDYAILAGGLSGNQSSSSSVVDTYTSGLTLGSASALKQARCYAAGASNGAYAIFAGGFRYLSSGYNVNNVDAYSPTLTKTTCDNLKTAKGHAAGGNVGDYAIIGGGSADQYGPHYSDVTTYNKELTQGTADALTSALYNVFCASNQNYAVFSVNSQVIAYNSGLTKTIAEAPPAAAQAAARAGNYVVFFNKDNMCAYDLFLTKTNVEAPNKSRSYPSATTLNNYALFLGAGGSSSESNKDAIDVYDAYLTRTNPNGIDSTTYYDFSAASIGNFGIFAGPYNTGSGSYSSVAYAYQYS